MSYLVRLLVIMMLLFTAACVKYFEHGSVNLPNHIKEYKQAKSAPKMLPSKQFKYDDQYTIPDVEEAAPVNSDALVIPPGSQR